MKTRPTEPFCLLSFYMYLLSVLYCAYYDKVYILNISEKRNPLEVSTKIIKSALLTHLC